jgi:hypothetical protein
MRFLAREMRCLYDLKFWFVGCTTLAVIKKIIAALKNFLLNTLVKNEYNCNCNFAARGEYPQ